VVVATYVIQHPAIGVPDEIIAPNKEKSRKDGNDPNGKVPFRVCFMRLVRVISVWSPFPGSFPQCVGVIDICVHEPQHAAHDSSFSYNIWCAEFYLRHTVRLVTISTISVWSPFPLHHGSARRFRGRMGHIVPVRHLRKDRACHRRRGHRRQ
jgi:hypothetical protein